MRPRYEIMKLYEENLRHCQSVLCFFQSHQYAGARIVTQAGSHIVNIIAMYFASFDIQRTVHRDIFL